MCGRFSMAYEDWGAMLDYFGISNLSFEYGPRYNVAPGQPIAAIAANREERRIGLLHWGLIPSFAKDVRSAHQTINARAETLLEKPAFRSLVSRKRCIIPADGFFEWKRGTAGKQPYRIILRDRPFFGLAGLYDTWKGPDGEKMSTCTVITTHPNSLMAQIHHRMPVILNPEAEKLWLDAGMTDGQLGASVLVPYDADRMRAYPVSPTVGNVRNEGPECLLEIAL